MRYFTYMAEQSFKTDAEGQRLFYIGNPFSRPYIIPDAATETRLFSKMTWNHRIFLSTLIVGDALLMPWIVQRPRIFFGFLAAIVVIQWLVLRLTFFADLRKLPRAPARLSLRKFYAETAARHSPRALLVGVIGSAAFAVAGAALFLTNRDLAAVGATIAVMFVACTAAWAYALRLKLGQTPDQLERKDGAELLGK